MISIFYTVMAVTHLLAQAQGAVEGPLRLREAPPPCTHQHRPELAQGLRHVLDVVRALEVPHLKRPPVVQLGFDIPPHLVLQLRQFHERVRRLHVCAPQRLLTHCQHLLSQSRLVRLSLAQLCLAVFCSTQLWQVVFSSTHLRFRVSG